MISRIRIKWACTAAGILLSGLCIVMGTRIRISADGMQRNITLQAENTSFDSTHIEYIEEANAAAEEANAASEGDVDSPKEDTYVFTAWKICRNQCAASELIGKAETVDVIEMYGPSECLLPFGRKLQKENTDQCIIGIDVARKLFGSSNASGQALVYQDRVLEVADVVKQPTDVFLVETEDIRKAVDFDRISILCPKQGDRKELSEAFINRFGLMAHPVRWDYYSGSSFFSELMPGKWSDISGWGTNIDKVRQQFQMMGQTEKSDIEELYVNTYIKSLIWLLVGAVLLATGICYGLHLIGRKRAKQTC